MNVRRKITRRFGKAMAYFKMMLLANLEQWQGAKSFLQYRMINKIGGWTTITHQQ